MNLFYREYPAPHTLKSFVNCFWSVISTGPADLLSPVQRCFPSGYAEWITHVKGPNSKGFANGMPFTFPTSLFSPVNEKAALWTLYGQSELFGIRLKPEAALTLYGLPFRDIVNEQVDSIDFMGKEAGILIEQLQQADTVEKRISLVELHLMKKAEKPSSRFHYLPAALSLIRQPGNMDIRELSRKLYVCERQLQRSFRNNLGISPKGYARMVRLFNAHQRGLAGYRHYSQLAYEMGYADPAHFTRDFKDYFGLAPAAFYNLNRLELAG